MARSRAIVVVLIVAALTPAVALAHRQATKTERRTILAAVVRQRQLSKAQAACQVVTISTINQNYAAVTWPARLSAACMRVAANGVIIEHHTRRSWQFVTVGSAFRCPIRGVPTAVARDLRVCS